MAAETTRTPTAAELYEVRRLHAVRMAADLTERLNIANTPEHVHYGHCGDLVRVIEGLADAIRWAPRAR